MNDPRPTSGLRLAEPDADAVRRLFAGIHDPATAEELWRHLRAGCQRCRRLVTRELQASPARLPAAWERALGPGFRTLQRRARQRERERTDAVERVDRLAELDEKKGDLLIRNVPAYRTWGIVERALTRAQQHLWDGDEVENFRFARLAVRVAEDLDPLAYGLHPLRDLQARAWGALGNHYRIVRQVGAAESALATARRYLAGGSGDLLAEANQTALEVSLLLVRSRDGESIRRIDSMLRRLGPQAGAMRGRFLLKRSQALGHTDPEGAVRSLSAALRWIPATERGLRIAAYMGRASSYLDLGLAWRAERDLLIGRGLSHSLHSPVLDLHGLLREGHLLNLLGDSDAAVDRMQRGWAIACSSHRLLPYLPLATADMVQLLLHRDAPAQAGRIIERAARAMERHTVPRSVLEGWREVYRILDATTPPPGWPTQVQKDFEARWYRATRAGIQAS